jgi:hypothetical protein
VSAELLAVALAAGVGSFCAVWGVLRKELSSVRKDIQRAHERIDGFASQLAALGSHRA